VSELDDLPGADLVRRGVTDAASGIVSVESLLVEIAAPRLRSLGVEVPPSTGGGAAEIRLYEQLGARGGADPYGEYNALLRRLSSFVHALEHRRHQRL
jgi:hypothetical protein